MKKKVFSFKKLFLIKISIFDEHFDFWPTFSRTWSNSNLATFFNRKKRSKIESLV